MKAFHDSSAGCSCHSQYQNQLNGIQTSVCAPDRSRSRRTWCGLLAGSALISNRSRFLSRFSAVSLCPAASQHILWGTEYQGRAWERRLGSEFLVRDWEGTLVTGFQVCMQVRHACECAHEPSNRSINQSIAESTN